MATIEHVLIDSNVLIDVPTADPVHFGWSSTRLANVLDDGRAAIDPVIFAELSVGFASMASLDSALPRGTYRRLELPWEAAFLAGQAFASYRRRGGARSAPLPDFYIGAHATVAGLPILTRDPARFATYFPDVTLIAPR